MKRILIFMYAEEVEFNTVFGASAIPIQNKLGYVTYGSFTDSYKLGTCNLSMEGDYVFIF